MNRFSSFGGYSFKRTDLDGHNERLRTEKRERIRVVHGSHFSVIVYLIFDISLPKTENDQKMKPKMSSKMATVNDPIVCGRIFFGKRKLS